MNEILGKLTSYNLFNYLLPGVLFVAILEKFTAYSLSQESLITGVFIYYFVGLVISRFGSLIIEPVFKKLSFLEFAPYEKFILASKEDSKIETLLEASNMYRAFSSMFILLVIVKAYQWIQVRFSIPTGWNMGVLVALLLIMFLYSYRKQTKLITYRIGVSPNTSKGEPKGGV